MAIGCIEAAFRADLRVTCNVVDIGVRIAWALFEEHGAEHEARSHALPQDTTWTVTNQSDIQIPGARQRNVLLNLQRRL